MTADELEAGSHKYRGYTVVPLSSGRYAIYGHWTQEHGLLLKGIGTWSECEAFLADFFSSPAMKTTTTLTLKDLDL